MKKNKTDIKIDETIKKPTLESLQVDLAKTEQEIMILQNTIEEKSGRRLRILGAIEYHVAINA